ncbi:MAG: Ig-like domain-containing protein, partial [Terracidiphilus sp.]
FSPDGKMFALYANAGDGAGNPGNGIEIYNFNGAAPLTLYQKLLTGTPIDQVAWDTNNHLYAISRSENKLYVFTVTSTSVTQDASYTVTSPLSMVVVSQTASTGGGGGGCTTPSAPGVNVCTPDENATVTSPVQIDATANVSGGVYRFELWNGSTKLLSEDNGIMDQTVTLAPGTYHLTFDARNSSGDHQYAYRDITVTGGSGGACSAPSGQGVNVCSPDENATVTSPVEVNAAANVTGGVYRFELWNGSTKLLSVDNGGIMDQGVSLAPGSYRLTFDAYSSSGIHEYTTRDITVK